MVEAIIYSPAYQHYQIKTDLNQIGCADYRVNPHWGAFILGENVEIFVTYILGLGFCLVRFQKPSIEKEREKITALHRAETAFT